MPCCDVINRGAALHGNLVIFATLDAQIVTLNRDIGEVVWKERIDNDADGHSASAAPLIAQGPLMTVVSGGEFGVVGRVQAPKAGALQRPPLRGSRNTWGGPAFVSDDRPQGRQLAATTLARGSGRAHFPLVRYRFMRRVRWFDPSPQQFEETA